MAVLVWVVLVVLVVLLVLVNLGLASDSLSRRRIMRRRRRPHLAKISEQGVQLTLASAAPCTCCRHTHSRQLVLVHR
jgi:uncharacterized SAM-binding protein YcdF (DUF218 family)